DGLPVDETTWRGIADAARAAGVPDDDTTLAAWNACAAA
ncbi:MAG TPA: malate/lactate/ureidoglycolate dehydrogenase, partial [Dermacoccus sp.]|nr:malate/lactate/ureidoglycolate dehydrogenase [Dermacoccus sp.]